MFLHDNNEHSLNIPSKTITKQFYRNARSKFSVDIKQSSNSHFYSIASIYNTQYDNKFYSIYQKSTFK